MFNDLKNQIDFFIRNKTKFSRKNFQEKNLINLEHNRLEILYTKNFLEIFFEKKSNDFARILDIGCKNWFYAQAEHEFFSSFCNEIILDGVELDPYRLYTNFYSRYEVAKFYTKNLINTNYITGNLLDINGEYDYIVWILPFVSITPHKYWGLPKKYFMPEKLLAHAYSLLKENGQMLIINQGETEAKIQKQYFTKLELNYKEMGLVPNEFVEYKHKRYAFLLKKMT